MRLSQHVKNLRDQSRRFPVIALPAAAATKAHGTAFSLAGKRVWVAGHRGMVGSAIARRLESEGCEIVTIDHGQIDLTRQSETEKWMEKMRPQAIFVAAARVGGIHANESYPADFLYDNLMIETNIIRAAYNLGIEKLMFLGSSCVYPREAQQPIRESALLTGRLEPTNEWYAIAKIAGIKLCQAYRRQHGADFISVMPTNIYGPGDNFHPDHSHVPAALLRRFHEAKLARKPSVVVWGTGKPSREFMYVDDVADGCVFVMKHYSGDSHINVGTGLEVTIGEFAEKIRRTVQYEGEIVFDARRPDGTPRKVMDVSMLYELGWSASTSLEAGLERYYDWFQSAVAMRQ
jgi:GDP-L-fucose synthase